MATAQILFQRFFYQASLQKFAIRVCIWFAPEAKEPFLLLQLTLSFLSPFAIKLQWTTGHQYGINILGSQSGGMSLSSIGSDQCSWSPVQKVPAKGTGPTSTFWSGNQQKKAGAKGEKFSRMDHGKKWEMKHEKLFISRYCFVFIGVLRSEKCNSHCRDANPKETGVQCSCSASLRNHGQLSKSAWSDGPFYYSTTGMEFSERWVRFKSMVRRPTACQSCSWERNWSASLFRLRTSVYICYQPPTIAASVIWLAAREAGVRLPTSPAWWKVLDSNLEDIKNIAGHIKSLYYKTLPIPDLPLRIEEVEPYLARQRKLTSTPMDVDNSTPSKPARPSRFS